MTLPGRIQYQCTSFSNCCLRGSDAQIIAKHRGCIRRDCNFVNFDRYELHETFDDGLVRQSDTAHAKLRCFQSNDDSGQGAFDLEFAMGDDTTAVDALEILTKKFNECVGGIVA